MYSTILPELMSLTVFILCLLSLLAGRSPVSLQNYTLLTINTTGLRTAFFANTTHALPIPDFYNLHITTYCQGYYNNSTTTTNPSIASISCSKPSTYNKFLFSNIISSSLQAGGSNATLESLQIPKEIQDSFNERFNLQLYVAFIFYVLALVETGVAVLYGGVCFWIGALGSFNVLFTSSGSTFLLIASAIATAVQDQATALINDSGNSIGLYASYGMGFLTLTWMAFGLSVASSAAWSIAGIASTAFRN